MFSCNCHIPPAHEIYTPCITIQSKSELRRLQENELTRSRRPVFPQAQVKPPCLGLGDGRTQDRRPTLGKRQQDSSDRPEMGLRNWDLRPEIQHQVTGTFFSRVPQRARTLAGRGFRQKGWSCGLGLTSYRYPEPTYPWLADLSTSVLASREPSCFGQVPEVFHFPESLGLTKGSQLGEPKGTAISPCPEKGASLGLTEHSLVPEAGLLGKGNNGSWWVPTPSLGGVFFLKWDKATFIVWSALLVQTLITALIPAAKGNATPPVKDCHCRSNSFA